MDQAVQKYHAGHPDQAIAMLKPLALRGDVQAQNLLGNIIYGLATTDPSNAIEDPLKWYQMAAAQGLPAASYAIGVIHHNNWLKTQREEDARLAEIYYQQALDRGFARAAAPLMKIAAHNQASRQSNSRKYSNASFSSKREPQVQVQEHSVSTPPTDVFSSFELSGDVISDSIKLEALLRQLNNGQAPTGLSLTKDDLPDAANLTRLLTEFGANASLVSNLVKLLGQIKASAQ